MNLVKDLKTGPIAPHLVKLTMPMFIGVASMLSAVMVDIIYIGHIGTDELAALGFCFPIIMTLVSLSTGVSIGSTSIVARFAGLGHQNSLKRAATHSLLLSLLLNLIVTGIGYLYLLDALILLGAEGDILRLASDYMRVWLIGYPVFSFSMFIGNTIRGTGEALLPGLVMLVSAVLQAIFAPFLIFGLFGLPRLELEGAGWSFCISRIVTMAWTVWIILAKVPLLTTRHLNIKAILKSWLEVLRISVPATIFNLMPPISLAIVVAILSEHGPEVVAAFSIAGRIEALATMALIALSSSIVPFAGQNWAGKQFYRAIKALTISYRFCLIYGLIVAAFLMVSGRLLIGFITDSAEVVSVGYLNLLWVSATFGFIGTAQVSGAAFLALGHARPVLILGLFRMIVIYVPLLLLSNHYFGYVGVFVTIMTTNLLMATVTYVWSRAFLRRQLIAVGAFKSIPDGMALIKQK